MSASSELKALTLKERAALEWALLPPDKWDAIGVEEATMHRLTLTSMLTRPHPAPSENGTDGEWRLIETAPKNGTDILAKDSSHQYIAWHLNGEWLLQGLDAEYQHRAIKYPTHWRPL